MPVMEKKTLHITTHTSPSFSQYGRSPSPELPAYTTDDLLAARYQRIAKLVHWIRLAIVAVSFCVSVSVIGCAGASLNEYSISKHGEDWILPPWPVHVDLRPTHAVLACGIITTVFSLTYFTLAALPQYRKFHTLNLASSIFALLAFGLSLFTVIFASVVTRNLASTTSTGSLMSWTCKWKGLESMAPANFTKICNEDSAALDLTLLLVILQSCAISASAGGRWVEVMLRRSGLSSKSQVELV